MLVDNKEEIEKQRIRFDDEIIRLRKKYPNISEETTFLKEFGKKEYPYNISEETIFLKEFGKKYI